MRQIFRFLILFFSFQIVAASEGKTIAIFTVPVKGVKPWDPDSIEKGIPGSEEAVIYMSKSLVKLGYRVIVLGNPPAGSIHSKPNANPRFIPCQTNIDPTDIAISWRMPEMGVKLKSQAKKVYLWPHDILTYLVDPGKVNAFDDVLWLSNAQREQWIAVSPSFEKYTKIFGNGIVPEQFAPVQERKNPYSCIYGSNYARGLEVLLNIWPRVKKQFPKATLDIYYGWQHWGLLSLEKEIKLRMQVQELAPLDVKEHGLVGHRELNQAYAKASLWTYPCTAFETFCITALRAQLAGAMPVVLVHAGLKETVRHGYLCQNEDKYFETLKTALEKAETISLEERKNLGEFVLQEYTWDAIAAQWDKVFSAP